MASAVLSLNGKPQVALRQAQTADGAELELQPLAQAKDAAVGDATRRLMRLLGAVVRVKIADGREVVGHLHCFDKHQNVIVRDAREFQPLHAPTRDQRLTEAQREQEEAQFAAIAGAGRPMGGRALGTVLVPGKRIVHMKVLPSTATSAGLAV